MSLFKRAAHPRPSRPAAARLARIGTGWLQSPYGQRAAVAITREVDRIVVVQILVGADRQPVRTPVYEGRSPREATKAANDLLQTLRLRGFRAQQPGGDAGFSVSDVCRTLNVALS